MPKKYNTIEELNKDRKELDSKFESGLPGYLVDFYDDKEKKLLEKEYFKQLNASKWAKTPSERYEYKQKQEENFWQENETALIKTPRPAHEEFRFSFKEPERNTNNNERELTQEEISVLVTLCEKDLYLFGIRYFPHYLKKPSSRLHKFLYQTISREINKYPNGVKRVVAAPRAGAKSTIVSNITPLWCICYNKKKFIIMLSDTLSQAEDFLYDIKQELELNEKLARDFPYAVGKGPVWRTNEIITNNGIKILALGTGNKIRGRRFGIYRPDLVLGDDLENSEMVKSEVQRDYIRHEWFNKEVIFVGGEEGSSTDFFIVGTSIGKDALLNALLDPEQYPDWKGTRFKAVEQFHDPDVDDLWTKWKEIYKNRFDLDRKENARKFFDENKEKMLKGSSVLWPEGDPYYNLMEYKVSNPSGFECFDENTEIVIKDEKLKKIKDIKEMEEVLTCDGSFKKVIESGTTNLAGRKVYDIKISGHMEKIRVTEDHPFFIWPKITYANFRLTHQHLGKNIKRNKYYKEIDNRIINNKLQWKKANELEIGDSVVYPVEFYKYEEHYHNLDWYWLVGLFLSEGSFGSNGAVTSFSMALDEMSFLERAKKICHNFGFGGKNTIIEKSNVLLLNSCSIELVKKLSKYGNLSYNKHLTENEDVICKECFLSLWDGFKTGDGYKTHNRSYYSVNSASRQLILDFQRLFRKFGIISYTYKLRDAGKFTIHNKEYNQRPLYQLALVESKKALQSWFYDDKLFSSIQSIEEVVVSDDYKPWWLSVEDNHTFCVPFAIVKNTEKQNEPIDITKIYVSKEDLTFKAFRSNREVKECINRGLDRGLVFGALDPSLGKKSKKGDFSCIVTVVRDPKTGLIFVIDIDLKRRSVEEQIYAILNFHQKFHYKKFSVETNAFQYVVAENLRKIGREEGIYVPIEEIVNYQDKKMRVEGIVPFLKDGTIIFDTEKSREDSMYARGIEQITSFTGENDAEDDCPDCLEMCFRIAQAPQFKMINQSSKKRDR